MGSLLRKHRIFGDLIRMIRLSRSGIFDTGRYYFANQDVPEGAFAALAHFCRFGRVEQRIWNQSPLGTWLVPYVLSGRLAPQATRRLSKQLGSDEGGGPDLDKIRCFCSANNLHPAEFFFHYHYDRQAYDAAYQVLAELPMESAFLHYFLFARLHMRLDHLRDMYDWVSGRLKTRDAFSLDFLIAAREVAATLGYPDGDRTAFNRSLLEAFARWPAPSAQARMRGLWQLGFPVIMDGTDLVDRILQHLPSALSSKLEPRSLQIPQSVVGWESVLNLVTLNAVSPQQHVLRLTDDVPQLIPLETVRQESIRLRVLGEGYWRQAGADTTQRSFLDAFKSAARQSQAAFAFVHPVATTQIYDLRLTQEKPVPTLSYHSVTGPGQRFLNFKESALPGYFQFDRQGFSGWISTSDSSRIGRVPPAAAEFFFRKLQSTYVEARRTKYAQPEASVSSLPSDFILVAMQVPNDTVMSLERMLRDTWLGAVVSHYRGTGTLVVVKAHPKDRSMATQERLQSLSREEDGVLISQDPIHALLAGARTVLTVNSGVGMEALLHLKPVITVGDSDYGEVAIEVHTSADLCSALSSLDREGVPPDWAPHIKAFLYDYFNVRCFREDVFPASFDDMLIGLKMQDS